MVAYVKCNGNCETAKHKYEYAGISNCYAANILFQGEWACPTSCLGYGDCAVVCPQGAISIKDNLASVDRSKCIGCGMCSKGCPANCIVRTDYVAPGHKLASLAIDADKCVKCGACISTCKFKAISKV